ncbi:UNVERIFIED_CONTAM: hypothetical protein Slati_1424400 [Sesamum latifolium]|uniref:Uncharacterized protein n=1 Tax=Sesamum latifolium TaxID=2727402 RepID=A0AAW2X926_9LAMI
MEGHLPANNDAIVIAATRETDSSKHTANQLQWDIVEPLGEISLSVSLGSYPRRATKFIKFLVVDSPSTYNIILGRPTLNLFQAVVSTYHLKIKLPTPNGIGEENGDRRQARECYVNTLKNAVDAPKLKSEGHKRLLKTTLGKYQEETPKEEAGENPERKTKEQNSKKNAWQPLKK